MTKETKSIYLLTLIFALFFVSCTSGIRLNTKGAQESEIAGTYDVILYGCNFNNDLETIAFLQKEGAQYIFEPFAPDFKYRTKKGIPAEEALQEAKEFANCGTSFMRSQLSSIIAPDGDILGYEVRPLYEPLTYGVEDVLAVDYNLKGDKVSIMVRLIPSVEKILEGGGEREKKK
jgi:hypothetical protein